MQITIFIEGFFFIYLFLSGWKLAKLEYFALLIMGGILALGQEKVWDFLNKKLCVYEFYLLNIYIYP